MNRLWSILIMAFLMQSIQICAEEMEYFSSESVIIDAGIGYNIHLNSDVESPVKYSSGGICFSFRLSYFFNQMAGISFQTGYHKAYSYQEDNHNSILYYIPLELAYNIAIDRLRISTGFGGYLTYSHIDAFDLVSKSGYFDLGYFAEVGYGFNVKSIKFAPQIKINFLIDTEIVTLIPSISFYYIF